MRVVVPFSAERPKTRLSSVLDADERRAFARVMLRDVLDALASTGHDPTVVATAPVDCDAPVEVDERPLTEAVNDRLPGGAGDDAAGNGDDAAAAGDERPDPVAVVMADLALATPAALERLFAPDADVVFAPGRGGGTNALVVRDPGFHVDYHGASIRDHRAIAREVGASTATVDSFRLATDVDEPGDLVEVLLHADGRAVAWLREAGFAVTATDGRVEATR
ncbi:2-phospho-L-lactate guanylyltransferase [Halobacteriales archaeon QH_7_68_42]|nr:MAG: 2-phospho-L-lactate guanylyltransferase [Halobacteriales archaeon QH_7_68_42]